MFAPDTTNNPLFSIVSITTVVLSLWDRIMIVEGDNNISIVKVCAAVGSFVRS